jgi:hypothetical protein
VIVARNGEATSSGISTDGIAVTSSSGSAIAIRPIAAPPCTVSTPAHRVLPRSPRRSAMNTASRSVAPAISSRRQRRHGVSGARHRHRLGGSAVDSARSARRSDGVRRAPAAAPRVAPLASRRRASVSARCACKVGVAISAVRERATIGGAATSPAPRLLGGDRHRRRRRHRHADLGHAAIAAIARAAASAPAPPRPARR